MEEKDGARNREDDGLEVFRCMTCGTVLGYYAQGSDGRMKCPQCSDEYRLSFREENPTMKRIARRKKKPQA